MPRNYHSRSAEVSDSCCVSGRIYQTCTSCGGLPRTVAGCGECGGAGSVWSPCPHCAGYGASSGPATHGGESKSYGGHDWQGPSHRGSSHQNYDSATRR
ncbi:uncharacterized protein BP5553_05525 [Venustampulla echinocandica]|uniref:Uncharacterized protein n=1 Tax=Venustampulla echinocandica TaxID=2656787 RepID=A0A370TRD7_9HELO|nr:uncharacterized protein BP5553_05525 [Venustampulla echinocandica]RDL38092.1 hypothetical protein BP5553_05525 [Venustampulla echinocandica]